MRTAGIYLIYAAVAFRALVRFTVLPQRDLVAVLLALYGLLLFAERWIINLSRQPISDAETSDKTQKNEEKGILQKGWTPLIYLLVQYGLVLRLLLVPPHVDFMSALFIPLSLQAVLYYGRRLGFFLIAIFTLTIPGPLLAAQEGWLFAPTMALFFGGLCFLFGGYALQVLKAETARNENQRMLRELQGAHQKLAGYAAQVEDLAVEQERSRMARELHDSVTQLAFSMNLSVQTARLLLQKNPGQVENQLQRVESLAASALKEIKALVSETDLCSVVRGGLQTALQRLAAERRTRDEIQVTLEVEGARVLSEPVAMGLYRIAQEALNNVAKHAGTREATIRLNLAEEHACLQIEDCGRGFDPASSRQRQNHLGLASMTERAQAIGWDLSIESSPGRGVRIHVMEQPRERTA